jgi:hypothetical protein
MEGKTMENEIYRKLVDLYAGGELPEELATEMEVAAIKDRDLAHEMQSLKSTVEMLRKGDEPEFTEESYHRILMKLYASGAPVETTSPAPVHMQYQLPIAG